MVTQKPKPLKPRETISFLVMTPTGRISFSADNVEAATKYRDTRHPTWSVFEQKISYTAISVPEPLVKA